MAVILELDLACGAKPDGTFAVVPAVLMVFVDCSEVAWLVLSVVEVSCKQHLVSEIQHFALSAFQIFRRGVVRQPVFSYCFVDCHFRVLGFSLFVSPVGSVGAFVVLPQRLPPATRAPSVCTYITLDDSIHGTGHLSLNKKEKPMPLSDRPPLCEDLLAR